MEVVSASALAEGEVVVKGRPTERERSLQEARVLLWITAVEDFEPRSEQTERWVPLCLRADAARKIARRRAFRAGAHFRGCEGQADKECRARA